MPEPSNAPPKATSKPFLVWGHILLWFGFLWLAASTVFFKPGVLAKTSRFISEGVPRKDSYTPSELHDAIWTLGRQIRNDPPWIFTPAMLMLGGGLLLGRASALALTANADRSA